MSYYPGQGYHNQGGYNQGPPPQQQYGGYPPQQYPPPQQAYGGYSNSPQPQYGNYGGPPPQPQYGASYQQPPPPQQQQYGGYSQPPPQHYASQSHLPSGQNVYQQHNLRQGAPPPPPSGMQTFGNGAPNHYAFQYSNCTGKRKALLIGINYFGQKGQLRGCINDVKNMSNYLMEAFGYKRE
ncbi:hypothetical protein KCU78_g16457, partial [Aureobasidium melanogenum]